MALRSIQPLCGLAGVLQCIASTRNCASNSGRDQLLSTPSAMYVAAEVRVTVCRALLVREPAWCDNDSRDHRAVSRACSCMHRAADSQGAHVIVYVLPTRHVRVLSA